MLRLGKRGDPYLKVSFHAQLWSTTLERLGVEKKLDRQE